MGEEKNKKMSQKPQNHPNASRNFGTSPLVDNPFELLDQAHHLLVQAAELLRKDRNPMASDIHRIVAMLLSITFMSSQQRRKSIKSSLSHPKQHTRLHHRERPLLASRAKVNSHPTITSIFPTDDVPNLTIAAQKMEDPGLESQKSLINLKISPSFDKDTDVDLPSLCNLEIISKKRSFFQKSELTRSLKLNRSVSSASCDASEGNSKKKRKDSGTEKQLKGQTTKVDTSLPASSSLLKDSCHQRGKTNQQCRPIEKKENQFISAEPPSCNKEEFNKYKCYGPHAVSCKVTDTTTKDDVISLDSDDDDDDTDPTDYGSLLRCKDEQDFAKKKLKIAVDSGDDYDACYQNNYEQQERFLPNEPCLIGISDFKTKFWSNSVRKMNFAFTEDLEKTNMIREDSAYGSQYGRTKFDACQMIFDHAALKKDEIFIDIGHGIGNAVIQAALTIGCTSRGVELSSDRFALSCVFRDDAIKFIESERMKTRRNIVRGDIDLRNKDFCDEEQRSFITEADVALVNNAMEIFSGRSQAPVNGPSLDDHIAGLFARMKPGARMVTFTALPLGLSLTAANEKRRKGKRNERYDTDASFFECETFSLGKECVSWTKKEINVYMYTRVQSASNKDVPMFTCHNCGFKDSVLCENSNLLIKNCAKCNIKRPVTGVREAAKGVQYNEDMINNSDV